MAGLEANVKAAQAHLEPGETIIAAVLGAYEIKIMGSASLRNGVFMATDRRLVFFAKKLFGYDIEVFPYSKISSIEGGKGFMGHHFTFFSSGNRVSMKWIKKGDVDGFFAHVSGAIDKNQGRPDQV
jgi:hypothetical protein